jgi:hypothetical protein
VLLDSSGVLFGSVLWLLLIKSNISPVARQRTTMRWYFLSGPFLSFIKEAVGRVSRVPSFLTESRTTPAISASILIIFDIVSD